MIATMETVTGRQKSDIELMGRFVRLYCADRHGGGGDDVPPPAGVGSITLCPDCARFMEYAVARRLGCPLEAEKPSCRRCRIHCFAPRQRQMMREIMAHSGRRMIMAGRLDYLWRYLF